MTAAATDHPENPLLSSPFDRIAILGTGLLGASVGLAARRAGVVHVAGFDADATAARLALERGAITRVADSVEAAVVETELAVVAVPVPVATGILRQLAEQSRWQGLVTDVCSTKQSVVAAAETFGLRSRFCGAHPMAGSANNGPAAAVATLFDGSVCYTFPPAGDTGRLVEAFWQSLGCRVQGDLTPAAHDTLVGRVSHLPHAVASALVLTVGDSLSSGGPGLRDTTRVAGGDPNLWTGILLDNAEAVTASLTDLTERLTALREALEAGDREAIHAFLAEASRRRRDWQP